MWSSRIRFPDKIVKSFYSFILLIVLSTPLISAQNKSAEIKSQELTKERLMKIILNKSLDINLIKKQNELLKSDIEFKKPFISSLYADFGYLHDEAARSETIFGDKNYSAAWTIGIRKELNSSTLDLSIVNKRNSSNSDFYIQSPYDDTRIELSLRKNISGAKKEIAKKKNIFKKETDFSSYIKKLEYDDQIEEYLYLVQKLYWELLYRNAIKDLYIEMGIFTSQLETIVDQAQKTELEKDIIRELLINIDIAKDINRKEKEKVNHMLQGAVGLKDYGFVFSTKENLDEESFKSFSKETSINSGLTNSRNARILNKTADIYGLKIISNKESTVPEIDLIATYEKNGISEDFNGSVKEFYSGDNQKLGLELKIEKTFEKNEKNINESRIYEIEKEIIILKLKQNERRLISSITSLISDIEQITGIVSKKKSLINIKTKRLNQFRNKKIRDNEIESMIDAVKGYISYKTELYELYYRYKLSVSHLQRKMNSILGLYR